MECWIDLSNEARPVGFGFSFRWSLCSVWTGPRSLWTTRARFSRFCIGAAPSVMERRLRKVV